MATLFRTCVRVPAEQRSGDASRILVDLLRKKHSGEGLMVRYLEGSPWVCIENLGFVSLKQNENHQNIEAIAKLWNSETIMLGVQTTASCGVYAHYLHGRLRRFLSAGDGIWFEFAGECEDWEKSLLKHEPGQSFRPGMGTLFDDRTVFKIASRIGLPTPDASGFITAAV
jgi:hypothetical protein